MQTLKEGVINQAWLVLHFFHRRSSRPWGGGGAAHRDDGAWGERLYVFFMCEI